MIVTCDTDPTPHHETALCLEPKAITPQPDVIQVISEARELYQALENIHGDIFLLGLCEIGLDDICEGSNRDAGKVLKRMQQYRDESLKPLAIGQKSLPKQGKKK